MLKLHVLASGSRGNAAIVENGATGAGVLIDCGICKREFFDRATACGFDVARLAAVVITHDHGDHVKGLGVVLRGLAKVGTVPAVHGSGAVFRASASLRDAVASVNAPFIPFACGDSLVLGGMAVRPFRTSHDAADACGFRFDELSSADPCEIGVGELADVGPCGVGEGKSHGAASEMGSPATTDGGSGNAPRDAASFRDSLGYVTDTGFATDEARAALAGVRLLALESNHDVRMLESGPYPYVVKQRIASDRGHLSNAQAAELLAALAHEGLESVVAMHISQDNNTYRLPRETLASALAAAAPALAPRVTVSVAYQDRPVTIG